MNQLTKDIREIISDPIIPWEMLRDKTILVTGATGLLGSLIIKSLSEIKRTLKINLEVIGMTRDPERARSLFIGGNEEILFMTMDEVVSSQFFDYVIHTASPTSSAFFVSHPVEVIHSIYFDLYRLLNFCKGRQLKSFVQLSSLEVYGNLNSQRVVEYTEGQLDSFSLRSSYPEAKRIGETLCKAFFEEYSLPCKVVRLTQCFGAGVDLKQDQRVFAEFTKNALEGSPIVLHTKGETSRSYVYTADAVRAIFLVLLRGQAGEVYNVANPQNYCSILELAQLISKIFNTKIEYSYDSLLQKKYSAVHKVNLDISKIEQLGWTPFVSLQDSVLRMLKSHIEK